MFFIPISRNQTKTHWSYPHYHYHHRRLPLWRLAPSFDGLDVLLETQRVVNCRRSSVAVLLAVVVAGAVVAMAVHRNVDSRRSERTTPGHHVRCCYADGGSTDMKRECQEEDYSLETSCCRCRRDMDTVGNLCVTVLGLLDVGH